MSDRDFDTYRLVRQLVRDQSKTTKEIAEITGYSRAYVSELRRDVPWVDAQRERMRLNRYSPDLLAALQACTAWMESLRESGDAGNWEWSDGDVYMQAMDVIAKATGSPT